MRTGRCENVKRLVLCSGKVAYDLIEARNAAGDANTAIVRIEQLYPFPGEPLVTVRLKRMVKPRRGRLGTGRAEKCRAAGSSSIRYIEECLSEAAISPDPSALCRTQASRRHRNRPCQAASGRAGGIGRRCPGP